jgi:hypothetical protein
MYGQMFPLSKDDGQIWAVYNDNTDEMIGLSLLYAGTGIMARQAGIEDSFRAEKWVIDAD